MKNYPIGKVSSNLLSVIIRISIFSWIIDLTKSNLLGKELTFSVAKIILFTFFILMFFKTSKTFSDLGFLSNVLSLTPVLEIIFDLNSETHWGFTWG